MKLPPSAVRLLAPMLVLAACATAGPRLLELTPWGVPMRQACAPGPSPPATGAVLDSTALAAAIPGLGLPDGVEIVTVRGGLRTDLELLAFQSTFPDPVGARLRYAMAGAVNPTLEAPVGIRVLARVTGGRLSELELGPSQVCRPGLRNAGELRERLAGVHQETGLEGTAHVRMFVDSTGAVTEARVEGSSGIIVLDQAILRTAREARFYPATWDRARVGVWVGLDFRVEAVPELEGGPS